jgi:hypothetical protein
MGSVFSSAAQLVDRGLSRLLSEKAREHSERLILIIAIASYLGHLALIFLNKWGLIQVSSGLLNNPISAIYTPFSFILVYEVYLLIFYLPKSTSYYIGKQYEIITLIVIRRIFKDIGNLDLFSDWFKSQSDLQFTYDAITSLLLFLLIYFFYRNIQRRDKISPDLAAHPEKAKQFVLIKKTIALLLVPVLVILAIYSLFSWAHEAFMDAQYGLASLESINSIFFDEFFTVLIIVDVLLLLTSFFYSDQFNTIIRNSGFVISTILIKLSFSVSGLLNNALVIGSVVFGLAILIIHNLYEKD